MEKGLLENTGKPLADWLAIVSKQSFDKHGEIINFLKSEHGLTHGYANFVAHKARESAAGPTSDNDLVLNPQALLAPCAHIEFSILIYPR